MTYELVNLKTGRAVWRGPAINCNRAKCMLRVIYEAMRLPEPDFKVRIAEPVTPQQARAQGAL